MRRASAPEPAIADTAPRGPWPEWQHVPLYPDAANFLGVTRAWTKRARNDGLLEVVRLRGTLVVRAGFLYDLIEKLTEPATAEPKKRITRSRSAEHNARIGAAVRARAEAKAAAQGAARTRAAAALDLDAEAITWE